MTGFAFIVFGSFSFLSSILFRGQMEKHYQEEVKEQMRESSQLASLTPSEYISEDIFKKKERILKDIYPCIKFFDRLFYEAKKELESE